ncbi:MAG: hypothetical protein HY514_02645 [Candidatus Aenigmarchaeota archaeon]|nr:hypothetical protein [Candidatus Aenigmarchaeota archaeon]
MAKIEKAISDSGPLIHLAQIGSLKALRIIKKIYIPEEVYNETCSSNFLGSKEIKSLGLILVKNLDNASKDMAKIIAEEYSLDIGESQCIALASQDNIKLLFTDDLSARVIAENSGLEVHGTVGIILRAYKKGIMSKKAAIQSIRYLKEKSSLFITSDLIEYILKEIEKYDKK